jgi:hypothetical protein
MVGLQAPLSTLRRAPRGVLRMTRGQSGLLFLSCQRLSLFTLCRSHGALACFKVRIHENHISYDPAGVNHFRYMKRAGRPQVHTSPIT